MEGFGARFRRGFIFFEEGFHIRAVPCAGFGFQVMPVASHDPETVLV